MLLPAHWTAGTGGAEMQAEMFVARLLCLNRYDIHIVVRHAGPSYVADGYSLHRIPARRIVSGTYVFDVPELWRLLRRLRPDVVYQRVGCAYTGIAAHYTRTTGGRMIWHVASNRDLMPLQWRWSWRSPIEQLNRSIVEYGARHADAIVVQNLEQDALLRTHYGRTDAVRISNFHPIPCDPIRKSSNRIVVCWIANIKPLKRLELFLQLASDFRQRQDVEFVVAGAPQMKQKAWECIRTEMHTLPNVQYVGPLSQSAVNDLLAGAHVLVNTSTVEGFPNTFIQAWLRKVPILSMAVNPDGVFDGNQYGIFAGQRYDLLKAGLQRLISDRGLREQIGTRASQFARTQFSERNIEQLIRLLEPSKDR